MIVDDRWFSSALFLGAALCVWWAGVRLPRYVAALADRTGLGHGLMGILILGGMTSPIFRMGEDSIAVIFF